MTREEMIEQLENTILLIKQNGKDWWDERDIPILEEAIKAMQTEPCNNAIDKQEVIKWYCNKTCGMDFCTEPCGDVKELWEFPFVQLERKVGHWIPRNSFLLQYKCSECGRESEKYNYCPNCGAKMEEGE